MKLITFKDNDMQYIMHYILEVTCPALYIHIYSIYGPGQCCHLVPQLIRSKQIQVNSNSKYAWLQKLGGQILSWWRNSHHTHWASFMKQEQNEFFCKSFIKPFWSKPLNSWKWSYFQNVSLYERNVHLLSTTCKCSVFFLAN